jgi:hypothetical protein
MKIQKKLFLDFSALEKKEKNKRELIALQWCVHVIRCNGMMKYNISIRSHAICNWTSSLFHTNTMENQSRQYNVRKIEIAANNSKLIVCKCVKSVYGVWCMVYGVCGII